MSFLEIIPFDEGPSIRKANGDDEWLRQTHQYYSSGDNNSEDDFHQEQRRIFSEREKENLQILEGDRDRRVSPKRPRPESSTKWQQILAAESEDETEPHLVRKSSRGRDVRARREEGVANEEIGSSQSEASGEHFFATSPGKAQEILAPIIASSSGRRGSISTVEREISPPRRKELSPRQSHGEGTATVQRLPQPPPTPPRIRLPEAVRHRQRENGARWRDQQGQLLQNNSSAMIYGQRRIPAPVQQHRPMRADAIRQEELTRNSETLEQMKEAINRQKVLSTQRRLQEARQQLEAKGEQRRQEARAQQEGARNVAKSVRRKNRRKSKEKRDIRNDNHRRKNHNGQNGAGPSGAGALMIAERGMEHQERRRVNVPRQRTVENAPTSSAGRISPQNVSPSQNPSPQRQPQNQQTLVVEHRSREPSPSKVLITQQHSTAIEQRPPSQEREIQRRQSPSPSPSPSPHRSTGTAPERESSGKERTGLGLLRTSTARRRVAPVNDLEVESYK